MLRRGRVAPALLAMALVGLLLGALVALLTRPSDAEEAPRANPSTEQSEKSGSGSGDETGAAEGNGAVPDGSGRGDNSQAGTARGTPGNDPSQTVTDPTDEQVSEVGPVNERRPAGPQPGEKGFRLPGLADDSEIPRFHTDRVVPADDYADGTLAAGYPMDLLPLPPKTEVVTSEVTSEGRRVRTSLDAVCACTLEEVIAFHDRRLSLLGLAGSDQPAVGGAIARAYGDGRSSLTLTVRTTDAETRFSLVSATKLAAS